MRQYNSLKEEQQVKKKIFSSITRTVLFCIILADFILCSLVFATSYLSFNRQFREQYDSSIREICTVARDCLNPDDFDEYLITHQKNAAYDDVLKILQNLVDGLDLNMIYVSAVEGPDYTHITYF